MEEVGGAKMERMDERREKLPFAALDCDSDAARLPIVTDKQ